MPLHRCFQPFAQRVPLAAVICTSFLLLPTMLSAVQFWEDYVPNSPFHRANDPLYKQSRMGARPKVYESISEIGNPSSVLLHADVIFISLFMENKILLGSLLNRTVAGFADGSYCATNKANKLACGIVEGPWGMVAHNHTLYVTQFGSDQVLLFSLHSHNFGWFIDAFGDSESLDCPEGTRASPELSPSPSNHPPNLLPLEGIAIDPEKQVMYIASYNSNKISLFALADHKYLRDFATQAASSGYLMSPESIALNTQQQVLAVASFGNNSVLIFSTETGQLLKVVGGFPDKKDPDGGSSSGGGGRQQPRALSVGVGVGGDVALPDSLFHLSGPTGIAPTARGTFAVTLYRGNAVVEVDAERGVLRVLADQGTDARLRGPTGIAYRHSSFIVASYDNKKVLIFNSSAPARSSAVLIDSRFSSQPSPSAEQYM